MIGTVTKNKVILGAGLIVPLMLIMAGHAFSRSNAVEPDKNPLRILYVGMPGTERQEDFDAFLSQHFEGVKIINVLFFNEKQAKGSDVVILDKDGIQWGGRGGDPLYKLEISDQYSHATLALGIPGAFLYDQMKLKPGYR